MSRLLPPIQRRNHRKAALFASKNKPGALLQPGLNIRALRISDGDGLHADEAVQKILSRSLPFLQWQTCHAAS